MASYKYIVQSNLKCKFKWRNDLYTGHAKQKNSHKPKVGAEMLDKAHRLYRCTPSSQPSSSEPSPQSNSPSHTNFFGMQKCLDRLLDRQWNKLGLDNVGEQGSLTICSGVGATDSTNCASSFKPSLALVDSSTLKLPWVSWSNIKISDKVKNTRLVKTMLQN